QESNEGPRPDAVSRALPLISWAVTKVRDLITESHFRPWKASLHSKRRLRLVLMRHNQKHSLPTPKPHGVITVTQNIPSSLELNNCATTTRHFLRTLKDNARHTISGLAD